MVFGGSITMNFKKVCCLIIFINYITSTHCYQHNIAKRAILFAENYVLQLSLEYFTITNINPLNIQNSTIFTTGCVTVPSTISTRNYFLNMCVQGNYMAINNASQFKPPEVISATATRSFASNDFSKNSFHKFFVEWLNEYGLDGESCLYRLFCETSKSSFRAAEDQNLLEKILFYIFTPSQSFNKIHAGNQTMYQMSKSYVTDCHFQYPNCHIPVLDFVSNLLT